MKAMNVPNKRTNKGAIITALVAILGIAAVGMAFVSNASPYGTFADARKTKSESMHVAGDILKESVSADFKHGTMRFQMKDSTGELMQVVYTGPPPSNLAEASKVVAIGGIENGEFHSDKLLIKCPSKYEGEKKPVGNQS